MKKQIHILTPRHHEHLGKLGIPWLRPPHIMADEREYQEAYQAWKETHPGASPDFLHMKALGHIAWRQHATEQSRPVEVKQEKRKEWLLYAVIVLIVLLLCVPHAHCQFSKINYIDVQNQGSDIGFFTSPFTVNFTGAGVSCANSAGVVTCTVTGGSITNNPGGSNTNVQFNNSGAFGGIANGTLGQVLISQGAGSTPAFADPLVQGTQAAASTTIPNPVVIGGSDYGGTAAVQTAKVTSAGALQTHETGTAAISAASLPLPTGAALDASLTTLDTDVKANITLHAGTNVIGHVVADSGSTTAVTGNVAVTKADGSDVTLGAKGDAKSTATDTTAISAMSVLKQISASVQAPPSQAVTNAGTFATQAAATIADGADVTLGAKADAKSTATDTTAVSAISVLKEISALEQAPASRPVTNAGTFADQATLQTQTDSTMVGGVNVKEINGVAPLMGNGTTGTGSQRVTIASDNTAFAVNAAATLAAETTKVIGTVRAQGNLGAAFDAATGAAVPANAVMAGLKDTAGNTQDALADTNGRQFFKQYPDTTTTSYRASKKFAASSTTDNAVMPGNATNTVLVTKIMLTCNQTTAGQINVELLKRSAADTVGTSAAMTAIPMDSNYAAAVSAPLSYTGTGPTVGTAVGDLDNLQIGCMAPATATPNDIFIFHPDKPIVLRGTAQQIAVNVGNAALTGGNITVTFEWEETTTP